MIEPGNDKVENIMRAAILIKAVKLIGENGDHLAPAIAGHVVGVEGGKTGHPILGGKSITGQSCVELTGW